MAAQATAVFQAPSAAPRSGKTFNPQAVSMVSNAVIILTFREKAKNGVKKIIATANEGSRVVTYYPDRNAPLPPLGKAMDCEFLTQITSNAAFAIRIVRVLGPSEAARLAAIVTSAAASAKAVVAAITPQPPVEEVVDQLVAAAMPAAAAEPIPIGEKIVAPEVHETPGQPKAADQMPTPEPEKAIEPSKKSKKIRKEKDGKIYNENNRSPRGKRGGASAVDPVMAELAELGM